MFIIYWVIQILWETDALIDVRENQTGNILSNTTDLWLTSTQIRLHQTPEGTNRHFARGEYFAYICNRLLCLGRRSAQANQAFACNVYRRSTLCGKPIVIKTSQ